MAVTITVEPLGCTSKGNNKKCKNWIFWDIGWRLGPKTFGPQWYEVQRQWHAWSCAGSNVLLITVLLLLYVWYYYMYLLFICSRNICGLLFVPFLISTGTTDNGIVFKRLSTTFISFVKRERKHSTWQAGFVLRAICATLTGLIVNKVHCRLD